VFAVLVILAITIVAGLIGSTGWGVWVAVLGVTVLLRPATATRPTTAGPRS